jgi:O-antigen/teichoic acid export membrane protein
MFMAVVTGAFRFAWQPFFLSHAGDESAPRLVARVMTYYVGVALFLFLGLTFFVPPLIKHDWPFIGLLLDERYWPGLVVFPLILFAHIFDGIYANLMVGVYLKKLTRCLPLATGAAAAFTIAANILLVPKYGMLAAAWITVFAFVIQAAIVYFIVKRYYAVPYEWPRILKLFLICIALVILGYTPLFAGIGYKLILFLCFPLLLYLVSFFDERELYYVKRFFARA